MMNVCTVLVKIIVESDFLDKDAFIEVTSLSQHLAVSILPKVHLRKKMLLFMPFVT